MAIKLLRENKILVGFFIFIFCISLLNPNFMTIPNILNILRQISVNLIISIGMTLVILSSGIDLSVGSILALSGALCAIGISYGIPPVAMVLCIVIFGFMCGLFNGVLISYAKLQPFIVTLVTMTLLRGATLVVTDGRPIPVLDAGDFFDNIGGGYIFDIPVPVYIMGIVFLIIYFLLKDFKFGRYIYAIGGNEDAVRLSGINVAKIKTLIYGICGALSALAGIVITSRLGSAQPTAGAGYELDAIAAVVLGGTSLSGGVGKITGTLLGAIIIGVLGNALNLLDVSSYNQMIIKAGVILVAVLLDRKTIK